MVDKEITKLIKDIDKNHKDLLTKYNVLVKRTSSIISSLSELNAKIDYLAEMMSMFELAEENEEEEFDPYHLESEDYEDIDNDDDNL
jgi:hypothetical protein